MTQRQKNYLAVAVVGALVIFMATVDAAFRKPKTVSVTPLVQATPIPFSTPVVPPVPILTPAQKREKERKRIEELRNQMLSEFEIVVTAAYSNYNHIRFTRSGNTLWASHSFFSQYSFDIGSSGVLVREWVGLRNVELKQIGIKRVGVRDPGGYGSSTWYNVN